MKANHFLAKGRSLVVITALVLGLAMAGPLSVGAQGGLIYQSGYQVQNLSGTPANISISYYNQSGGTLLGSVSDSIPANGSKTYFPISLPGGGTSFNGSIVISSDQPLAAISNISSADFSYGEAYSGFSAGSTSFSLPLVMCNNSGYNTWFNVQDAGTSAAHITINYIPGLHGTARSEVATIQPGAAKTFDQQNPSSTGTVNCSTMADGSGRFVGGATISSDQPVVAVVIELNTTTIKTLLAYNGFAAGATTMSLPLIMANNSSFSTGVQVQNVGGSSTNVTLKYGANTGGAFSPAPEAFTLAPGASKTIIQAGTPPGNGSVNNWAAAGRYIGSAVVTNTGAQPLVAVVNEAGGSGGNGPFGGAYEGFNPAAATARASAPLIMSNNGGFNTGVQIQNAGASTCGSITLSYSANTAPGGVFNPAAEPAFSLAAGASKTILQSGLSPANGSVNNWGTAGRYIGSAAISAPGCQVVAIVNELKVAPGDFLYAYDAANY